MKDLSELKLKIFTINMDIISNLTRNSVKKLMIDNQANKKIDKKEIDTTRRKKTYLKNVIL